MAHRPDHRTSRTLGRSGPRGWPSGLAAAGALGLVLLLGACAGEVRGQAVEAPATRESASDEERPSTMRIYSVEEDALVEVEPIEMTEEQWREQLEPEAYHVLREAGTERAFSGRYWKSKEEGIYRCAGCGTALFSSEDKFSSGTGWPSYTQPVHEANITTRPDHGYGMVRTEILCSRCGGHLGHVFGDGPPPTGLRYCINSAALELTPLPQE